MLVEDVPVAMAALFRSHVDAAIRRSVASEGDAAHVAQLAVGFLDLAGSTSMIRALEPDEVAAAMTDFEQCAVELVSSREGRVVKTIGDEVMFVTTTATAACDVALEVQRMVDEHDVLTAVRGGIAAGALVRGYGDFYGAEVNRAARTVEIAQRGTILVSSAVRERRERRRPVPVRRRRRAGLRRIRRAHRGLPARARVGARASVARSSTRPTSSPP